MFSFHCLRWLITPENIILSQTIFHNCNLHAENCFFHYRIGAMTAEFLLNNKLIGSHSVQIKHLNIYIQN